MTPLQILRRGSTGAKPCAEAPEVGELALLSTRGIQLLLLAAIDRKWLGAFAVVKHIAAVACDLSLPSSRSHICGSCMCCS